jgi:SAM-dependent methyltransferase
MLEFITKKDYFIASSVEKNLRKGVFPWHLKSVQDAIILHNLEGYKNKIIGEIGGGDSRILPYLSLSNSCTNIEKFEGNHGGPSKEIVFDNIENVRCWIGNSSEHIESNKFDILFSVSVVEHIENHKLEDFIEDCYRILKPGGIMLHAVDMYLPQNNDYLHKGKSYFDYCNSRISLMKAAYDKFKFLPIRDILIEPNENLEFNVSYATNPDNIMKTWNLVTKDVEMNKLRENSQSVSLLWGGKK